MYFANWTGHSMVLPDKDAAEIYQTNAAVADAGTGVTGPAQNQLNDIYKRAPFRPRCVTEINMIFGFACAT